MQSTNLPWWQQVTALVSLSASGAVTGFTLAPNAAAGVTPPASTQIRLLATAQAGTAQAGTAQAGTAQAGTGQADQAAASNGAAHRAAVPAPRPPESVRPAAPARGAARSAGGSGASPATLSSADAKLAPDDSALRPAIVNVASYYLRMAANKTPAEMEAIIWQHDSLDGVDHGPSCAAFASLTLELGAQAAGQQSWVTGGASYPWPLHEWADVRVDPNPASPGITSVKQDAQAHGRWHPLGDGYQPQPGDWVLFDGHVEVVTQYSGGNLHTIGGDSLPNFSVNAHEYTGSLAVQGIEGFVNNGELAGSAGADALTPAGPAQTQDQQASSTSPGLADIPGSTGSGPAGGSTAATDSATSGRALSARGLTTSASHALAGYHIHHIRPPGRPGLATPRNGTGIGEPSRSSVPGTGPTAQSAALDASTHGIAAVPGLSIATHPSADSPTALTTPYSRHLPALPAVSGPDTATRRAFISEIAPGAIATQRQYGIPAAVTIAQAIDESGWGQSDLAVHGHNLFGIKGSGPAGRSWQVTEEFDNGQYVTRNASFRVYNNVVESINDHGKLLATSGYYRQAMAEQHSPDGFASALTGVYATDPSYGAKLISLMRQYDLYRYDLSSASSTTGTHAPAKQSAGGASIPGIRAGGTTARTPTDRATPTPPASSPPRGSTTTPPVSSPPRGSTTTPPVSSPPRGSTTTPPVSSPPRTTPPTPTPPRISSPPRDSTTPPPPRVPAHLPTAPPRTVTPPKTVTLPGLVAAPGSVIAPGSVTPVETATSQQTAALPGTGIAIGTGLGSGITTGTGAAIRTPRASGTATRARAQIGPLTGTGPQAAHGPDAATTSGAGTNTGPRLASRSGAQTGPRPASGSGAQASPRPAPEPEAQTNPQTASGPGTQAGRQAAGPSTVTKHWPSSPVPEIPGTTTAPAPAPQSDLALGGSHLPGSQSGASAPDHTTASSRSSSGTRLSAQTVSAQLIADIVSAAKSSTQITSAKPTSAQLTAETMSAAKPSTQITSAKPTSAQLTAETMSAAKPSTQAMSTQAMSAQTVSPQAVSAKPISARLTPEARPAAKPSAPAGRSAKDNGSKPRDAAARVKRSPLIQYHHEMPNSVRTAFVTAARGPLLRAETLYRDVASHNGIRWELLAACDWMQCEARQSHSPVHGEKLGAVNPDGTSYRTKSAALEQCADDLIELAGAVYGIDLLARGFLSVRDLANVFGAFRWGGLLKQHRTSAMEFPYSVAGLTPDRMNMRWPNIAEPHAPDKPGARFRRPFGAVPVVLNLHYPVTA